MMKKIVTALSIILFLVSTAWAMVNINTAGKQSLDALPGIGPVKAQAIIDYRAEHSEFENVNELLDVNGIGPKTLERIQDEITVDEVSSLSPGTAGLQ